MYPALFTVPTNYKLVKRQLSKFSCSYCGVELGDNPVKLELDGQRYEFCDKKHASELQKEFDAALEGGYTSLLKDLIQQHGSFKGCETHLDAVLKSRGIDRPAIKRTLSEGEESE